MHRSGAHTALPTDNRPRRMQSTRTPLGSASCVSTRLDAHISRLKVAELLEVARCPGRDGALSSEHVLK
jgi:hypothetical protein